MSHIRALVIEYVKLQLYQISVGPQVTLFASSHHKFTRTLLVGYAGSNTITRKYFKDLMTFFSERSNGSTFQLDNAKFKDLTDALLSVNQ